MKLAFAIPGDLATPTGGYVYDRRVLELLPDFGIVAEHLRLGASFPNPTDIDIAGATAALEAVPHEAVILADGLAFGALPERSVRRAQAPIVALVHHPLALETGTLPARADELAYSERRALAHTRHVIVTSGPTAEILAARYDVPHSRITVAEPGVDPAPRAEGSGGPTVRLLAVGSVSPRKAFGDLVAALAPLKDLDWMLTIVGPTDRDPAAAAALAAAIASHGLGARITLTGAVDAATLAAHYATADLFVVASRYEGYGMVVTEALAHGLPLVSTTGGALAQVVPEAAAARVPPSDVPALSAALRSMIADPALRRQRADAAWALAMRLPRWTDTARTIARVVKGVAA